MVLPVTDAPPKEVSWQSAFWPIIACMLTVMLQNTGRVCRGHFRDSGGLRSSPIVCGVDTILMLVEFVCRLAGGCSIRVAAKHVWYGRFEKEDVECRNTLELWMFYLCEIAGSTDDPSTSTVASSIEGDSGDQEDATVQIPLQITSNLDAAQGSTVPPNALAIEHDREQYDLEIGPVEGITGDEALAETPEHPGVYLGSTLDHTWRLSMGAFMLGAFPQAIKVFGMKGIPGTQFITAVLFTSFLVPEVFRLIAGAAGEVNPRPMPAAVYEKEVLGVCQISLLLLACAIQICFFVVNIAELPMHEIPSLSYGWWFTMLVLISIGLAFFTTIGICSICYQLPELTIYSYIMAMVKPFERILAKLMEIWSRFVLFVADIFALNQADVGSLLAPGLLFISLSITFGLSITHNVEMESMESIERMQMESIKCMHVNSMECIKVANEEGMRKQGILLLVAGVLVPCSFWLLHIFYRLVFMGSFSRIPRKLFGLEGSMTEFCFVTFILSNFLIIFLWYSMNYSSNHTFKPEWADSLG